VADRKNVEDEVAKKKAKDKAHHTAVLKSLGYDEAGSPVPLSKRKDWAQRHPVMAKALNTIAPEQAFGAGPAVSPAGFAAGLGQVGPMQSLPRATTTFGIDAQGRPMSQVAANETIVPKTSGGQVRDALRGALMPTLNDVHSRYGVGPDDSDTVLNGFMDSTQGREIGAKLMSDPSAGADASAAYDKFVSQWSGKSAQVDLSNAQVVDATSLKSVDDLRKTLGQGRDLVLDKTEKLGFQSPRVVVHAGEDKGSFDPGHALDAAGTPYLSVGQFLKAIKVAGF
jgi:hypothetical protein